MLSMLSSDTAAAATGQWRVLALPHRALHSRPRSPSPLPFPAAEPLPPICSTRCFCAQSIGASRHLIQTTLQDEVFGRNAGRLEVMDGRRVSGLLWSDDHSAVLGECSMPCLFLPLISGHSPWKC